MRLAIFHSADSSYQMQRNLMLFWFHWTVSCPTVDCIHYTWCYSFLLNALNLFWHKEYLHGGCCDCRIGDVASTVYTKVDLILYRAGALGTWQDADCELHPALLLYKVSFKYGL